MKCSKIIEYLELLAPASMACQWDNPGLLAGRNDKEVKKIWLALDATDQVIDNAAKAGADMLITHHPLIFKPLKKVNDEDFISRRILKLIQQDISYYAIHTNFDCAPGCMADLAAEYLQLQEPEVLEPMGEQNGIWYGIGKTGVLKREITLTELAELVKDKFNLPFVTLYGNEISCHGIRKVSISPGSGSSMIGKALEAGAQVLITGDIGHHDGIDAAANGLAVIDAGHYGLEHIFMDFMKPFLETSLQEEVEVVKNPISFPSIVI